MGLGLDQSVGTLQHAHSTSTSTKTFVQPDPSEQTLCRDRSSLASRRCKGDLPTLTAAAAAPTGVDGTRMRSWSATDQDRCRASRTRRRTAAIRSATAVAGNKYAASPDRYMRQPFSRSHSHTPGPVQSCVGHIGQSCSTRALARTVANSQVAGRQSPQQVLNLYSAQPQTINAAQMSIWVYAQVSAIYR